MLTNYHTHTTRCGHAEGTEEEYILTALRCGFKVLGFSDHTPWAYATPGFVSRIRMLPSQLDIPLEYNMAGLTLQDRPDGSLGYTRDEFWRIAAEYPVKAIMGCDAHAPSELDVVPSIEGKKAFLHSLGIPVLDTLPGLE